jgi:anion-transporting  ArsA/GET3 family ATPase
LLFESNAKDRFGEYFGRGQPLSTDIVSLAPNLWGVNTNPAAAIEEYGLMILKFRRVYKMVFENRVTRYFLRAIPGLEEYAILGKAWFHTTERERGRDKWDTIVFDMPASGHSLSMLRVPWAITEAVPDGPLTRDAHQVRKLLTDSHRTTVLMVTLAEDMPSNEAVELSAAMKNLLQMNVSRLVVNQLYPDCFPAGSSQSDVLDAIDDEGLSDDLRALHEHGAHTRARRKLNEEHLAKLERELPVQQIHLPRLFVPALGPSEVQELSRTLEQEL